MFLEIQSAQDVILQLGGSRDTTTSHTFTMLHIDRTCIYIFITQRLDKLCALPACAQNIFRQICLIDISKKAK